MLTAVVAVLAIVVLGPPVLTFIILTIGALLAGVKGAFDTPSQPPKPCDHWFPSADSTEPLIRQQTATGEWVWRYPPRR